MTVCEECHASLGCKAEHLRTVIHCGQACGVCSRERTNFVCESPIANEIASYNRAVALFTLSMRAKFLMNLKDKGGWQDIHYEYAFKRLLHESGELGVELMAFLKGPVNWRAIIDEASDVANFAMFIGNRAHTEDSQNRAMIKHTEEILAKVEAEKKPVEAK